MPVLILGATIFDTTLVTRFHVPGAGLLPFTTPGKDHAAHRLANLGLGHRGSVLSLYLLGAFSGAAAILVSYLPTQGAALVGLIALCAVFAGVALLEKAPYERQLKKAA